MNCKKILSIVLCLSLLLCFSACQKEEPEETPPCFMPYSLQFGMTYDEFAQQLSSYGITAPALEASSTNASYVPASGIYPNYKDSSIWDFLDSATMTKLAAEDLNISDDLWSADFAYTASMPAFYFSFNQNKQLYEFYCIWGCYSDDLPSAVIPEIITNYNAKLGITGKTSTHFGEWVTDSHKVCIEYSESDAKMILVHHCVDYNLDS